VCFSTVEFGTVTIMESLRVGDSTDERLRELLAVEKRLQDRVRAAREAADRRIAAAREDSERRIEAARTAAAQADAERARAEARTHQAALAAIEAAHRATLASLDDLSDDRVDELARWALAQAIATGETP
jgi:hypothetical protein